MEQPKVEKREVWTFGCGGRVRIAKLFEDHEAFLYKIITVGGWAKTVRASGKEFVFVELNDGSHIKSLQIVVDKVIEGFEDIGKVGVGASLTVTGTLIKSPAKGQLFELQLSQPDKHKFKILGASDNSKYPLSKKKHSVEFLREIAHIRPRSNLIGAVTRVADSLAFATHEFFHKQGFLYIRTPLITTSDCEGAGELFQITSLLPKTGETLAKLPTIEDRKFESSLQKQLKQLKTK